MQPKQIRENFVQEIVNTKKKKNLLHSLLGYFQQMEQQIMP